MAVSGCLACIRYLVMVINFIFWLVGIALLGVAVWLYIDTMGYLGGSHVDNEKFFISIYILMGVGCIMTLVGFLGCCGAMQESSCMLATFSTFVLLIFAAEVGCAVYTYSHKDEVIETISKRVEDMITNEYSVQEATTIAVDAMQKKLRCCGATGPGDWSDSVFHRGLKEQNFAEKLANKLVHKVPGSCCIDESRCRESNSAVDFLGTNVYSEGCIDKLIAIIKSHVSLIIGIGIGIAVIQIFGFVFSLVLCCAVSRDSGRY